jgi:hypothetical protein
MKVVVTMRVMLMLMRIILVVYAVAVVQNRIVWSNKNRRGFACMTVSVSVRMTAFKMKTRGRVNGGEDSQGIKTYFIP